MAVMSSTSTSRRGPLNESLARARGRDFFDGELDRPVVIYHGLRGFAADRHGYP
jgi:hypothetical protein